MQMPAQTSAAREYEGAFKTVVKWLTNDPKVQVKYTRSGPPCADIKKGVIYCPPMNTLSEEDLMKARTFYSHEGGHILLTADLGKDHPEGALFSILNALEDCRIEKLLANQHDGCREAFRWASEYFNKDIAVKAAAGEIAKQPLWEALSAMQFMSIGVNPAWPLSEKAKRYADAFFTTFMEIKEANSTRDALAIAKKIYELLKDAKKEMEQEQQEQQKKEQEQEQKKQEKKQKQEQKKQKGSKKQEKGSKKEEEGEEKQEQESEEEGQESEEKPKKGSKEESEESEEGEGSEESDGEEEGDENGEGEREGEQGEGEENGEGGAAGCPEDIEDEEESEEKGSGKSEGEEEGEGDVEGEQPEDGEGSEGNGEGSEGGSEESESGEETETNESAAEGKAGKSNKTETKSDKEIEAELNKEAKGESLAELLQKELEKLVAEVDPNEYSSVKDNDVFRVPETTPEDAGRYEEMLKQVAPMVMQMTRSLEQAIRTITMSKKATHMPRGKLDMKRLVPLVTGLDKRVFFRKEEGLDLDVAVSIAIDESGSMRHGKSDAVRDMAIVLGEVLDQLGIPFEIVGGTTANVSVGPPEGGFDRTNPIVVDLFKTFGENWKATRPRMLRVNNYNNYIDGEVIEMEAKRLLGRRERRKIVFSLSDGSPNAGHDNNRRMGQNLIEVCEKVRKAGVEVFGFGIGTDEPKQFYGEKWFVYLESIQELGQKFISEFAGIISKGQLTFA